jgi:translin
VPGAADRLAELQAHVDRIVDGLTAASEAREQGLVACRRAIRASGSAIRSVHRGQGEDATRQLGDAEKAVREAQQVLAPFPALVHAGFLHDAEKEYAEARLTAAFVSGDPLLGPDDLGVEATSWLRGLAEAASELRRYLLDQLRAGELGRGEEVLATMGDVYAALVQVDFPDAMLSGLRRTTDALRAVLERTRGDVTITVLQERLRRTLDP